MTIEGIMSFLKVPPFKAFTLQSDGGETYRVVTMESIHLAEKLGLVILYPPDGSLVMLDLWQITSATYPPPSKSAKKAK